MAEARRGFTLPDWARAAPRSGSAAPDESVPFMRRYAVLRVFVDFPETGTIIATAALFIAWWIATPDFATLNNLLSIAQQISFIGIVATGMTFLLIAGELDL